MFFGSDNEQKINPYAKEFSKKIKNYRIQFGELVNKIKHENARLCGILLREGKDIIPGYFLEGIQPDGALGPDPGIHKDANTAFSFSRDLRFNFVYLLQVSEEMAHVIEKIAYPSEVGTEEKGGWLADIAQRLAKLPKLYYPDEVANPNPWVSCKEASEGNVILTVSLGERSPTPVSFKPQDGFYRFGVQVFYSGDAVTRSFKLPYS